MDNGRVPAQDARMCPERRERDEHPRRAAFVRVNGIVVLAVFVALGIGTGSAFYRYKQPRVRAQMEARLDAAPTTAEGRLEQWHEYGAPMIHHRITQVAPFSAEMPWLIVHALADPEGGPPEIWGIELDPLPKPLSHIDGMKIVVELPAVRILGRRELAGDRARYIPVYGPGAALPDPREELRRLARAFLERLPDALEQDIEGASLEIRVGER